MATANVFSRLLSIALPDRLVCEESNKSPAFTIELTADGIIPFPQIILRQHGREYLIRGDEIRLSATEPDGAHSYSAEVSPALLGPGEVQIQIEGCRKADFHQAGGADWIKTFRSIALARAPRPAAPRIQGGDQPVLYFGIHKHMHQPYYDAVDPNYWDGEKDSIFGSRGGPYVDFVAAAIRQYEEAGLPHGGLTCSWSGSLIEQLDRCAEQGRCGGRFSDWTREVRAVAHLETTLGNPRLDLSAFGHYHPLMPLIPERDIVRQIQLHRELIPETFGAPASNILFPPETAFHPRIIPALNQAGIQAVMYDSIHRYRTCKDYPYGGMSEGMLPPNPADQVNPPVSDWLRLHNVWTGSEIAPSLLKPEYLAYTDPDGVTHKIIGIPAERYIGNEDARGGFGALQYPDVFEQLYQHLLDHGGFDPKHPPFLLLHSDGDNHGGGAESYYRHNTARMIEWLGDDPRFELIGIADYLQRFPPDPDQAVHVEAGSWSGADNGDPQFMKWFSRYREPYSPDLNSWAVLTALQNAVHTLEDAEPDHPILSELTRLLLTAEASDYWYWTGQSVWDQQVTNAANRAWSIAGNELERLAGGGADRTGPTIFPPWVTPENPGGKQWGQGCLEDAPREGRVHSFVYDLSGVERVTLHLRSASGEQRIAMTNRGPYPCQTGAKVTAQYVTADLPVGLGDLRYFIEAEDHRGNVSRGALERIFLA
ncbi:glycosyl hydrolase family 57 [Thiorhodococcus minor]|uniref:Glycosyl hydrolase family 57 n=1 Tax=Thiorhodococcus minor TaxID=57489 RepID=A0A6M0K7T8_9GAMM|nr:glycosyl hydrolase family 57 [Thiorhodococcus minor]NEV65013.1 glycosyl hydrolase family 57 [Thiorhodococcus minor]